MKKDGLALFTIILLVLLINLSFVLAADDPKVEKARTCLTDKVKDKCKDLSVEERAFTLLAIGKCSSELQDKSKDDECWPSSGCDLRNTALAVWALDNAGKTTSDAEDWILEQKKAPPDLIWYLEIDAEEETTCKISYGSTEKTIKINENKKIDKSAGTCLALSQDNYWLKINEDCYETNFTISCNKDFQTTLLYSKKNSPTIYVSSETDSASADGKTEERVNAFCFKKGDVCDYEGSLWATFALAKTEHDVSAFLPYLMAMAEDNEKFFPSAFLYSITDYDSYFTEIINLQKDDYWKTSNTKYNKFYDTSLALLALRGVEQAESAKTYLLEIQDKTGCWNNDNIRDTAFVLFAGWPKIVSIGGGEMDDCEDYKHYCVPPIDCSSEDKLDDFVCLGSGGEVCCKTEKKEETCDEKDGKECDEDEECTGSIVPASDADSCCKGECKAKEEKPECEEKGNVCRNSCLDDEEDSAYKCSGEETCCAPKTEEKSYWWIWLLIILIILVVLAIIFRNQLRIWLFRAKSGFRRGPAPSRPMPPGGFPPAPPARPMPMARPRMIIPRQYQPPARQIRRPASKSDKELEETLKKLKEMSK